MAVFTEDFESVLANPPWRTDIGEGTVERSSTHKVAGTYSMRMYLEAVTGYSNARSQCQFEGDASSGVGKYVTNGDVWGYKFAIYVPSDFEEDTFQDVIFELKSVVQVPNTVGHNPCFAIGITGDQFVIGTKSFHASPAYEYEVNTIDPNAATVVPGNWHYFVCNIHYEHDPAIGGYNKVYMKVGSEPTTSDLIYNYVGQTGYNITEKLGYAVLAVYKWSWNNDANVNISIAAGVTKREYWFDEYLTQDSEININQDMARVSTYTAGELTEWRRRWAANEYPTAITRITDSANNFNGLTLSASYVDPKGSNNEIFWHTLSVVVETAYDPGSSDTETRPYREARRMRDASFKRLMTEETTYDTKLKEFILSQIRHASVDFSNRTMWTLNIGSQMPMFNVGEWLAMFFHAYEYCEDLFDAGETTEIEDWLTDAGNFFRDNIHNMLDRLWGDRENDDYSPSGYTNAVHDANINWSGGGHSGGFHTHVGGHKCSAPMVWHYQNRLTSQVKTYAYIGHHLDITALRESSGRIFKEFVKFNTFSDGLTVEYERGYEEAKPEAGFYYAGGNTTLHLMEIAGLFARGGDTTLFDYTTTDGFYTTGDDPTYGFGGTKSIWKVVQTVCELKRGDFVDDVGLTGANKIYSKRIESARSIDGDDPYDTFTSVRTIYAKEHYYAEFNSYYQDTYVRESYLQCLNTGGVRIAPSASFKNDEGSWGTTATMELMHWNMDQWGTPYSEAPYVPVLSIVHVNVGTGNAGDQVILTGGDFDTTPANNLVKFNGVQATVNAASISELTVTVPETTTGLLTVEVDSIEKSAGLFTILSIGAPAYFYRRRKKIRRNTLLMNL